MPKLFRVSPVAAIFLFINVTLLATIGFGKDDAPELETEQQKMFYYMGTLLGDNLLPMQSRSLQIYWHNIVLQELQICQLSARR